ncbi:MAG: transketolase [Robiginitomaculum sp.]|nr:MAG: transketolase [Robiginitomaculum sp.]
MTNTAAHNDMANAIRFLSMDAIQAANSGHPGAPMGLADAATVLFTKHLKIDPSAPKWADRDRFVLSAGHASMLQYSLHYLVGYDDMTIDQIKNFRQFGAITAGHPEYGHVDGVEATTGPLGQGISMAVGMALAERLQNARYGDDLVNHYTYAICGDGCLMEGISHEAIDFAGNTKLDRLIVLWDDNNITIDGTVDISSSTDQVARLAASGWHVQSVDGHDADAIDAAIIAAKAETSKPSFIAVKTIIGYGAPNKAGTNKVHGAPLGPEEIEAARASLGWDAPAFEIPENILDAWRTAGARSSGTRTAWEARLKASGKSAEFNASMSGQLPADLRGKMNAYIESLINDAPKVATRKASQMALEVVNDICTNTIGGSADLTGSNLTLTNGMGEISANNFSGRYVYYGVREHAMAAIMNGIELHGGFIPYGGTFFVFAGYMLGAMRLSSLMGLRSIYVLTHDSIGLGEDGPTHQAVETLATLRALPNMLMMRPADVVETAEAWECALLADTTPTSLALTRQGLPTLRTTHTGENMVAKGAYILRDTDGARDITLLATGSEVHLAVEAAEILAKDGIKACVVSMPCWELFDQQDASYRAEVLGTAPRIAIEAALGFGWERYTGNSDHFVGMTGFGASAPADKLFEHFGITTNALVNKARNVLK